MQNDKDTFSIPCPFCGHTKELVDCKLSLATKQRLDDIKNENETYDDVFNKLIIFVVRQALYFPPLASNDEFTDNGE